MKPVRHLIWHLEQRYGKLPLTSKITKFKRKPGDTARQTVVRFCDIVKKTETSEGKMYYFRISCILLGALKLTAFLKRDVLKELEENTTT